MLEPPAHPATRNKALSSKPITTDTGTPITAVATTTPSMTRLLQVKHHHRQVDQQHHQTVLKHSNNTLVMLSQKVVGDAFVRRPLHAHLECGGMA
jgi:hypothetical protein